MSTAPSLDDIASYLLTTFQGAEHGEAYGYRFFYCRDDRKMPFATLADSDNEHDAFSNLSRPGVFRLNFGVKPTTYKERFGERPRLGPDHVIEGEHDFAALDTVMPHPQYAPQSWLCVLSPSAATFDDVVKPLLAESWALADKRAR